MPIHPHLGYFHVLCTPVLLCGIVDAILMVVDKHSKFACFIPLCHMFPIASMAHLFMDHISKLHMMPLSITFHRDGWRNSTCMHRLVRQHLCSKLNNTRSSGSTNIMWSGRLPSTIWYTVYLRHWWLLVLIISWHLDSFSPIVSYHGVHQQGRGSLSCFVVDSRYPVKVRY